MEDKIKYLDEYGVSIIADEVQKALEGKADGSAGVALRAEGDENGLNIAENYALAKNIPTKTSDLENDSLFVSNQTLQNGLNKKVDKIDGKTLTTHDFTTAYKNKLESIESNANNYTLPQATSTDLGGIKTGYTTTGKTYAVVTDTNGNAYVAVPWEKGVDTNTTYTLEQTGDVIKLVGSDGSSTEVTVVTEEVTLTSLGITATAKELNILDGADITTDELNTLSGASSNIQAQLNAKVPNTRKVNGKALSSDITLGATDVGADASGSAAKALSDAKAYVDAIPDATSSASGHMSATDKSKLDNIASGAEVNQNAFSKVTIGTTTIVADTKTDTLTLEAGANVTLTADASGDKVTIAATDTKYSAGTGIGISGTSISNTGVRSVSTGTTNGTISVNTGGTTKDVSVKGLGSAAYTATTAYATAAQGALADAAMPKGGGTFTGAVSGPTPTADAHLATKSYVDTKAGSIISATDALVFKGTLGTNGTITALPTTYKIGWTYRVITAGTYAGQVCEVGDLITAIVNRSGSGNANSDWTVAQTNINGALTAASNGLTADGSTVKHNDYITAGSISGGSGAVGYGGSFTIPKITYNAQGHITKVETTTVSLPKSQIGDTKTPVYINSSGVPTPINYTIQANVPSGAIFTDKNVQQTPTSTEASFPILLAPSDATGGANGSYFASSVNVNPSTGVITATGFSGKGSALTDLNATQLTTGTIPVERLADSKVTAGSYGPTANATPGYGATFNVPQVTVDKYGRVVGATTYTVKIPASDNTDTKNTAGSTNSSKKLFLIGAEAQGANPQTYSHDTAYVGTDGCLYSDSKKVMVEGGTYPYVKLDGSTPMTGDLVFSQSNADRFIRFTATTDTTAYTHNWRIGYLGSGDDNKNYLVFQSGGSTGTFVNALQFGAETLDAAFGGNILPATTNTQSIGSSSLKFANIYATTFTGNLSGNATTATTANKLASSTDKGSSSVPVYFKDGVPVACGTLSVGTTGNAGSATKLTTNAGGSSTPVYFSGGKPVACTSLSLNTTGNAATATTSNYQAVLDIRDAQRLPSYFTAKSLTAYFNNTGMPGSGWHSGIHVKGWSAGYQSWELASGSNTALNGSLHYRNGIDGAWEDWKQIAFITDNVASATKASKLSNTTAIGSATKPVYFSADGVPVEGTYTLGSACQKSYVDSTSNSALSTSANLVTERDVYYGLVTVNGAAQTRATGIYAPTGAGADGQILVSSGGVPTWKNQTVLAVNTASKLATPVTLTVGNTGKSFDGSASVKWTLSEIGALPTAGGTITGSISYKTTNFTSTPIKINDDGTTYGHILRVGASGTTIVGAGESIDNLYGTLTSYPEDLYLTADGNIQFFTYCNTIANRVGMTYNTNGYLYPQTNNTGSVGTSNNKWASMYATTFVGALSGNATTATTASKVANALSINGKTYNGSAAINAGTIGIGYGGTGATNALTAFYNLNYRGDATNCNNNISIGSYYWSTNCTNTPVANSYGLLYNFVSTGESHNNSSNWIWQLGFITSSDDMYLRKKINNNGWGSWVKLLHSSNYTSYTVKKDGTGASGSWGISVTGSSASCTGNAASATKLTTSGGSSTLPVYFSDGKPVACGTSLAVSVTGNAATATTATAANKLNVVRSISGTSHADALKTEFTNNKASIPRNQLATYYSSAYSNGSFYMGYFLSNYDSNPYGGFFVAHYNTPYYVGVVGGTFTEYQIWKKGDSVTGAVWNDYAECRKADTEDFGYVLTEVGDDTLTKTTERLQHFAGISSDTWGFSQGETANAKTPIAVAGRVLVYPYQPRENYHPGDCVCAAPGGMVDIMTREEVINYPDRIVGTVSCVPNYDEWGGGENADRKPVKVNGRIWVKVR